MKNVQTDLGKNGNKLSMTDKDGKTMSYATGDAIKLTEADFGVPFYPGAKLDDSKTIKIVSGEPVPVHGAPGQRREARQGQRVLPRQAQGDRR